MVDFYDIYGQCYMCICGCYYINYFMGDADANEA